MTDSISNSQEQSLSKQDVAAADTAGQWMAWTGLGFAVLWWAGAVGAALVLFGADVIAQQSPAALVAIIVLVLLPGFMMLLAGLLARQTKRTSEANMLLLKAADRLLSPAKQASLDIVDLGQAARNTTIGINRTVTEALTAMKATHQAMADERLRVESVSYAMADNARDLTRRLADERAALESLSQALSDQADTLNKAIPRQAAAMVAAAKQASEEVSRADEALEIRLEELKQAGSTLAVRLIDLDAVARDAASRTDALNTSVSKIEQKLEQSQRTIQMAERASEMAVNAAATTGDALRDAISSALDGARDANKEIAQTSQLVQERSTKAMAELVAAGRAAASAAARVQEQSQILGNEAARRGTVPAAPANSEADIFEEPAPAASLPSDALAPSMTAHNDYPFDEDITRPEDDLFDGAPVSRSAQPEDDPFVPLDDDDAIELGKTDTPFLLNQSLDNVPQPEELTEAEPAPPITGAEPSKPHPSIIRPADNLPDGPQSSEWRDIIADIGNEADAYDAPVQHNRRADDPGDGSSVADALIHRLESTGIPLSTAFKSRDKKKIAAAAAKDTASRRAAIRQAAGNEVDRVAIRLKKDKTLMEIARTFVATIELEALQTLQDTGRNGRHASTSLAAYLLVDAAVGDTLAEERRRTG